MMSRSSNIVTLIAWLSVVWSPATKNFGVDAFSMNKSNDIGIVGKGLGVSRTSSSSLNMANLDLVTSLRTEWIATSLCTNQTPRSAKVVLQLGSEDGRALTMIPRTVETFITSSAEADGQIPVSTERQVRQQAERRGAGTKVRVINQKADDLSETKDESVDVVISIQAAERMYENGLDWTKSVREAARVLKPGGRLLFVEKTTIGTIDYIDCVMGIYSYTGEKQNAAAAVDDNKENESAPVKRRLFEMVGFDEVDMVLVPHIAGVVMKSSEAGMTDEEIEAKNAVQEKERLAELSISAFERGLKKRKKKKKGGDNDDDK